MLSTSAAFTAEAQSTVRQIAHSLQVAWKKDYRAGIRNFTIGVSSIGGSDPIASSGGVTSDWNRYLYNDESDYVLSLGWERELSQPIGGVSKALADARLSNTSGRFSPYYAGGNSELFTALLPRRPLIINAGFKVDGVDVTLPQFVGITNKAPKIDTRSKTVDLSAADFNDYLQNRYVDQSTMFTNQRSDVVIESLLSQLGYSTSQYELDYGLNILKFASLEAGARFSDILQKIVEAENGQFYQDEEGKLRFENRQHWQSSPHDTIQRIIATSMVIDAMAPSTDHIINVVEVKAAPREVKSTQLVWSLTGPGGGGAVELPAGSNTEIWANFADPIYSLDTPTVAGATSTYEANSAQDAGGTSLTSSISLKSIDKFAQSAKMVFSNNGATTAFMTVLDLWGKPARLTGDIYYREQVDSSVTAYEERVLVVENDYIQDASWAQTYAGMILQDFAQPESLMKITIRALPELQLGDYISWQGRYWRVYGIRATLDPGYGFIQELSLLQRQLQTYFRIGISSIGGSDKISP